MILAFDVTERSALFSWTTPDGGKEREVLDGGKAAEFLVPTIHRIRGEQPLVALGVVRGPGSFTGIRVGLATALGFKTALDIPVFGFSKFDLVAAHMGDRDFRLIMPSGRSEVMTADFQSGVLVSDPQIIPNESYQHQDGDVCIKTMENAPCEPLNIHLTDLVLDLMQASTPGETALEPLYIRPPDAKQGKTLVQKLIQKSGMA